MESKQQNFRALSWQQRIIISDHTVIQIDGQTLVIEELRYYPVFSIIKTVPLSDSLLLGPLF